MVHIWHHVSFTRKTFAGFARTLRTIYAPQNFPSSPCPYWVRDWVGCVRRVMPSQIAHGQTNSLDARLLLPRTLWPHISISWRCSKCARDLIMCFHIIFGELWVERTREGGSSLEIYSHGMMWVLMMMIRRCFDLCVCTHIRTQTHTQSGYCRQVWLSVIHRQRVYVWMCLFFRVHVCARQCARYPGYGWAILF